MIQEYVQQMFQMALVAREKSYSPYSHFKVGAALKFKNCEQIFAGSNVENASYGACICAERSALVTAINQEGSMELTDILVITASTQGDFPCGICLQMLSEFVKNDCQVHIANLAGVVKSLKFSQLFPYSFDSSNLPDKSSR